MVWVIAFGELFFGDLWCVVWGYGGMRTHFSLLNPPLWHLLLPLVVAHPWLEARRVLKLRHCIGDYQAEAWLHRWHL